MSEDEDFEKIWRRLRKAAWEVRAEEAEAKVDQLCGDLRAMAQDYADARAQHTALVAAVLKFATPQQEWSPEAIVALAEAHAEDSQAADRHQALLAALGGLVEQWRERASASGETGFYARNDKPEALERCADELAALLKDPA